MPFTLQSPHATRTFDGRTLSLHRWDEACEALLAQDSPAPVLRIRLAAPAQA